MSKKKFCVTNFRDKTSPVAKNIKRWHFCRFGIHTVLLLLCFSTIKYSTKIIASEQNKLKQIEQRKKNVQSFADSKKKNPKNQNGNKKLY